MWCVRPSRLKVLHFGPLDRSVEIPGTVFYLKGGIRVEDGFGQGLQYGGEMMARRILHLHLEIVPTMRLVGMGSAIVLW